MSECKFDLCDGSGETVRWAGLGTATTTREPCLCALRAAATVPPSKPPEMTCSFWGCNGCPACIPGYVP